MILADVTLGNGIAVIIFIILLVMLGPPIALLIIGLSKRDTEPDRAKRFYIAAVVYVLISGGICASLMN